MKWSISDHHHMARAMQLARVGLYTSQPNPRVGCVIVNNGKIVGEGSHLQAGKEHAEIIALNQAGDQAREATCYVTLEPCAHTGRTPPCNIALIDSGVREVIAAMVDPNPRVSGQGLDKLAQSGVITGSGLLEEQAITLNRGYYKRMKQGMPWVRCKMAMSLDGKTALSSGQSKWITGEQARLDVQRLRAESCAVMTGTGTVLADNPSLNVRDINTLGRQPIRVIIDRQLRTPAASKIFENPGRVLIYTSTNDESRSKPLIDKGAVITVLDGGTGFLKSCLKHLAENAEVNEILVEAGPGLSGAMLEDRLIDELVIYQASVILGDKALNLFKTREIMEMSDTTRLKLRDVRHIGDDMRFTYEFNQARI